MSRTALRRRRRGGLFVLRGLLLEPASTNYAQRTSAGNQNWGMNYASVAEQAQLGRTAELGGQAPPLTTLTEPGSFTVGTTNTVSIYFKHGIGPGANYSLVGRDTTNAVDRVRVSFDVDAAGKPINLVNNASTVVSGVIDCTHIEPGLYRVWGAATTWATVATSIQVQMVLNSLTSNPGGVYAVWALPQIEPGRFPTSPILNSGYGSVTRARDDYTSGDLGALWAASAGTALEDSTWLAYDTSAAYVAATAVGGLAAGTDDVQLGIATSDLVSVQVMGVSAASAAGAGNNRADHLARKVKAVRLGGGTQYGHVGGASRVSVANAVANADTRSHYIRSMMTAGVLPAIVWQHAAYNADIGAVVVDAIDGDEYKFPLSSRTAYLDFRTSSLPAGITFTRSTGAVDDRLLQLAVNTPRFVRKAF